MNKFQSIIVTAASVAALALSASAFASEYGDAVRSARTTYSEDMAKCKTMSGADRSGCMNEAKATRHTAMMNARSLRHPHEADKHNEGDEKIKN